MPPPPFWGGLEKFLVQYSKVMSKTSLNPENHVYSSIGMTSPPPLATCSRKVVAPFQILSISLPPSHYTHAHFLSFTPSSQLFSLTVLLFTFLYEEKEIRILSVVG